MICSCFSLRMTESIWRILVTTRSWNLLCNTNATQQIGRPAALLSVNGSISNGPHTSPGDIRPRSSSASCFPSKIIHHIHISGFNQLILTCFQYLSQFSPHFSPHAIIVEVASVRGNEAREPTRVKDERMFKGYILLPAICIKSIEGTIMCPCRKLEIYEEAKLNASSTLGVRAFAI